jgi:chaperone modulatory protein CbpM
MLNKATYEITEIIELYEVNEFFISDCIERNWIIPIDTNGKILDKEDIARILLIKDLKEEFGANDESIPIILHLVDQLHWSQMQIKHYMELLEMKE